MSTEKEKPAELDPPEPEDGLPDGWVMTTLGTAYGVNPGKPAADYLPADAPVTFVPMPAVDARTGTIANPVDRPYAEVRKGFTAFRDGDVIFAKITPCMENGKAAIASGLTNGLGFGSTEFHVLRPTGAALAEYGYLFIRQECFRRAAESEMTGSVGQRRVPAAFIESAPLPLPPVPEQRRIVEKVETLLARVDAARNHLASVPRILNRFRQAVLASACSGRLTADWRDENPPKADSGSLVAIWEKARTATTSKRAGRLWGAGIVPELSQDERELTPDTWTWAKVRQIGPEDEDAVQVGPMSMQSRDFRDSGVPVLNVGCVQWGWFDLSKLNYMPQEKTLGFDRYRIRHGDVLFTRSGTVGRCAVAGAELNGYLMTFHLLRVRADPRICLPTYLYFVFRGAPHVKRQTDEGAIGSTRAGFNTNLLADIDIPVPPLPEQQEIVRRVESLFALADRVEQRVAAATARADRLTQAILSKAFRGELLPQDPDDEPAAALLERARAEDAAIDPAGVRNRQAASREKRRGPLPR